MSWVAGAAGRTHNLWNTTSARTSLGEVRPDEPRALRRVTGLLKVHLAGRSEDRRDSRCSSSPADYPRDPTLNGEEPVKTLSGSSPRWREGD